MAGASSILAVPSVGVTSSRPHRAELSSRADIDRLVEHFYERAMVDPLLAPVFEVLAIVGLDDHLVVVGDFWEQILFRTTRYEGAFTPVHRALHGKYGLTPVRFERWRELWHESVDELFTGVDADRAKSKADAMVTALRRSVVAFHGVEHVLREPPVVGPGIGAATAVGQQLCKRSDRGLVERQREELIVGASSERNQSIATASPPAAASSTGRKRSSG